jgi:DNA-binding response OmpR family regulator/putative methionine-R-sulfoxide reductase with GAF domain
VSQHRVLIVDDERFFREAIGDVLGAAEIPHLTAATGADALELAADPAVGVLILDLELPDLHGLEVFRRLKQTRPELRVVILSASTQEEHVLEALRLGAFDYLAKPLHEEELLLSVRRALDTFGIASGWQSLRTRVDRLQSALAQLWAQARADGASRDEMRDLAVRAAAEVLGAARTSLMLVDENASELRVVAAVGNKIAPAEMDGVPVGQGVAGLAHARGEALLVADIAADERFATRQAAGVYASSSFAVAPLLAGARTLGVLCATERSGGDAFGEDDLVLLRIIAGQVAHMLQAPPPASDALAAPANAELDVELDAAEAVLLETDGGLTAPITDSPRLLPPQPAAALAESANARGAELAREICDAVTSEVEPARILSAALRPIAETLAAAPVAIYLRSPETGELARDAEHDGGDGRSDRAELPATRGLAGAVLATGQLVATGDPTGDPRFDPAVDTPASGVAGPLICGALRFRGKPIGVFRVFPARPEDASPELGELLAAALSAAVRNVLLYRSLLETIEEVAEARRAGRANPQ